MKTKLRIDSILNAHSLDDSIAGFPCFHLSELELLESPEFELPSDLRLGHLAERVVSGLINSSSKFNIVYENFQIVEDKKTIGEIDFIIEEITSKQLVHIELAYKFYLFDPNISTIEMNNWIGPNRNDSLKEKLDKLKTKQFPLLYKNCTKSALPDLEIDGIAQALCLLVSLFIPFQYKSKIHLAFKKAIKGYYINFETFAEHNNANKSYYFPPKQEWGIEASEDKSWLSFYEVESHIKDCMNEKQAPLCWQKYKGEFVAFFIVWW